MLRHLGLSTLPTFGIFGLFFLFTPPTFATEPSPIPIRPSLLECHALLSSPSTGDGLGIPLSEGGLEDFKRALKNHIEKEGLESLKDSVLYVTGVEMGDEARLKLHYEQILSEEGIPLDSLRVKILSAPRSLLMKQVEPGVRELWNRMQYFFPSLKRDFQKPLPSEIFSGILTTIPLELPSAVYLLKSLPSPDAEIVLGVHTATLFAYTVFSQTLLNWLLRPGTGRLELFIKQCTLSMPFILNYRLFGTFSDWIPKIRAEGSSFLLAQGPAAIADFIATDGFTTMLQTVFYSVVITRGAGGWVTAQTEEANLAAARAVRPVLQAPILMVDALLLAYATTSQQILFHWGPLSFNDGHALLIGLTGVGWAAYRPAILDRIGIRPYQSLKQSLDRLRKTFSPRGQGHE